MRFHRWLLFFAAFLASGCLSRPSIDRQYFAFSSPPAVSSTAPASGLVLGIRRLGIAAQFDNQSFVYRTGEFSYERDPYAQFLVPPQESLAEPIRAYLRNSGVFDTVAEADSTQAQNLFLEISVTQLYGDFHDPAAPASVLSMRFVFLDSLNGRPNKVLLQKEYSRRLALKARTAAAVMAGWNESLKQIMEALRADERF